MTTSLDAALYYAGRGWPVFPLQPGDKKPMKGTQGFLDAVTTEAKIREWWGKTPEANIGIATGNVAKLAVVDVDFGHGGEKSLAALIEKYGELPETIVAKTGGGGRHFLFEMPAHEIRNTASKLAPGIDTRGEGGYICAAPSLHPSGARYMWLKPPSKTPLAKMPEWMVETLTALTPLEYPQAASAQSAQGGAFPTGSRNQTLTSLAGTMRRRGMSEEAIYTALLTENKNKCVPPLSPSEVAAIAKNVCKYAPTAAPLTNNSDRLRLEWAFARAVYDSPKNCVDDFQWLPPDMFGDDGIARYWQLVLDGRGVSSAAGEAGILLDLEKTESDPLNIDTYAKQISKFGYLAGIAKVALNIQRLAETGDTERVEQAIEGLKENKSTTPATAKSAADGLAELAQEIDNPQQFIKTGLANFDDLLGGLARKKMSIVAGRPGMGKTTFAFQLARIMAAEGKRVLFISLEMSTLELWQKAAYGILEISEADIQNGKVSADIKAKIRNEIIPDFKKIYDGKLFTYDSGSYSMMQLYKVAANIQPDLTIIDHLRKVEVKEDNEVKRLGIISEWGKAMARKLDCHTMILAQLNRGIESREDKEPQQSDLRDSGRIEEDADLIIMPYRPGYYSKDPVKERYSQTNLFIRKNRSGATGVVGLYMDMLQQWFYRREELPPNFQAVRL